MGLRDGTIEGFPEGHSDGHLDGCIEGLSVGWEDGRQLVGPRVVEGCRVGTDEVAVARTKINANNSPIFKMPKPMLLIKFGEYSDKNHCTDYFKTILLDETFTQDKTFLKRFFSNSILNYVNLFNASCHIFA